ncbi:MAG TPA: hypothetical protein VK211_04720 [Kamptonema sp.]|nr:hypothetical protein [Kamptonema sp.]
MLVGRIDASKSNIHHSCISYSKNLPVAGINLKFRLRIEHGGES